MKKIGTYDLCSENVDLFLRSGTGGEFSLCPPAGKPARIVLGDYGGGQAKVVQVLIHEAFEMLSARRGLRLMPAPCVSSSHADYMFVMTHEQMNVITEGIGALVHDAVPDIFKALPKIKRK